jgi:hypothetical protein
VIHKKYLVKDYIRKRPTFLKDQLYHPSVIPHASQTCQRSCRLYTVMKIRLQMLGTLQLGGGGGGKMEPTKFSARPVESWGKVKNNKDMHTGGGGTSVPK